MRVGKYFATLILCLAMLRTSWALSALSPPILFHRSAAVLVRGGGARALSPNKQSSISSIRPSSSSASPPPPSSSAVWTSFPRERPFAFNLIVATGKTLAADLVAQVVAEKKGWREVDWKRSAVFVVFGSVYLGAFQWWLQIHKFRQWFPTMDAFAKMSFAEKLNSRAGLLDAGKMVLFDVLIHLPLIYFPVFYSVKEFVFGSSWNPAVMVTNGLTKYSANFEKDYSAGLMLWGPSDCIQFSLPVWLRLPYRHFVSFFWTAYVSFTRGAAVPTPSPSLPKSS